MEIKVDGHAIYCRTYQPDDFGQIQQLNQSEGWNNLTGNPDSTKRAWEHSEVSYVLVDRKM
ncbi:hypothetical protein [Virgibacillus senegalensis]|uniref:hypothetical protein n=1 Tax=Virgibacillus senegalensis TaxID=1499679 RepID=UPI000A7164E5|nr:hypothetical protein [Virgibacillus senegalensis]